jgi:glycosyltransferase involved in cell wall biosynthesis
VNIVWLTGRRLRKDLAGSTEIGLFMSLKERGNQVHVISPDKEKIDSMPLHSSIGQSRIKGLQSISTARKMSRLISKSNELIEWADIFLVDWRVVVGTWKALERAGAKWWIIDRGPPAYRGILARLQNLQWSRAWEIANNKSNGGFVVSKLHEDYVRRIIGGDLRIVAIPAGTNIDSSVREKEQPEEEIRFVYSGMLDNRRGVREIIGLLDYFPLLSIRGRITIIGEGDESAFFESISRTDERVIFLGKLSHDDVIDELNRSHIGILPMPNEPIWRLASPLKLAEYLASGMFIVGPKHEGNSIEGEFGWDLLSNESNWQIRGIKSICEIIESGEWSKFSRDAVSTASEHLNWRKIGSIMESSLTG